MTTFSQQLKALANDNFPIKVYRVRYPYSTFKSIDPSDVIKDSVYVHALTISKRTPSGGYRVHLTESDKGDIRSAVQMEFNLYGMTPEAAVAAFLNDWRRKQAKQERELEVTRAILSLAEKLAPEVQP